MRSAESSEFGVLDGIPHSALILGWRYIGPRCAEADFIHAKSPEAKQPHRVSKLHVQVIFHSAHSRLLLAGSGIQEKREAVRSRSEERRVGKGGRVRGARV